MRKNSIVTSDYHRCFICHREINYLEDHHVFFGTANRKQSEKYGLKVPLCPCCHRGSKGVHHNKELDLRIKQMAQIEFEKNYSFEEFMKVFGKNYR